jgi:hypothetical protein
METKLKYDWGEENVESDRDVAFDFDMKNDISSMVAKGCRAKKLKSKIKKLEPRSVGLL